jgi:hypothetical protein
MGRSKKTQQNASSAGRATKLKPLDVKNMMTRILVPALRLFALKTISDDFIRLAQSSVTMQTDTHGYSNQTACRR